MRAPDTWGPADWAVVFLTIRFLAPVALWLIGWIGGVFGLLASRVFSLGKGPSAVEPTTHAR